VVATPCLLLKRFNVISSSVKDWTFKTYIWVVAKPHQEAFMPSEEKESELRGNHRWMGVTLRAHSEKCEKREGINPLNIYLRLIIDLASSI
jgi:hypothetical protein